MDSLGKPQLVFRVFSDAQLRGSGRNRPAGLGAVLLTMDGYTVAEDHHFVAAATSPEAEMRAVLLGLQLAAATLRNARRRQIIVYTDCQTVVLYLAKNRGKKAHLEEVRRLIRNMESLFQSVEYVFKPRDTKPIRRCETLAGKALTARGFEYKHRGTKGRHKRAKRVRVIDFYYGKKAR